MEDNELKFLKATYLGNSIEKEVILRANIFKQDFEKFDFIYAPCIDTAKFKDCRGEWHRFRGEKRALERPALEILKAIQFNPGIKLDQNALIELTGLENAIICGPLPRYIFILRLAFKETKESEYFIYTEKNPLTVEWPKELTWIRIEPYFPCEQKK